MFHQIPEFTGKLQHIPRKPGLVDWTLPGSDHPHQVLLPRSLLPQHHLPRPVLEAARVSDMVDEVWI